MKAFGGNETERPRDLEWFDVVDHRCHGGVAGKRIGLMERSVAVWLRLENVSP